MTAGQVIRDVSLEAQIDFMLTDEERALREEIRGFVADEIEPLDFTDWEWRDDPADRVPWRVIEAAHERGLQDLTVPAEHRGRPARPIALAMAAEEVARGDVGIAITLELLWRNVRLIDGLATEVCRERFFADYLDDPHHLLALCLTEPEHGSDYHVDYEGMRFGTTAEPTGDGWSITGEKRFISCGAEAKTHVVYAQSDPDVSAQEGTTAFLVPADADGVEITHHWDKVGGRLLNNATVRYDDVSVAEENVLGAVDAAKRRTGEVLKIGQLNSGAIALGNARGAVADAMGYAHERVQGGRPIVEHQAIAHELAEVSTQLEAARAFLWTAALAVEHNGDAYEPAYGQMAKVFAGVEGYDVARRSLEVFGGLGVMLENDRPIQKRLRDASLYLHGDGTRNAHNEVIADALQTEFEAESPRTSGI